MATNKDPTFGDNVKHGVAAAATSISGVKFTSADTTTAKTVYIAGADGAILEFINAHSDDTSAITIQLALNDETTDFDIGEVVVPIAAGSNAGTTSAKNLLDSSVLGCLRSNGTLLIGPGVVVKANAKATMTAAKTLTLFPFGVDF